MTREEALRAIAERLRLAIDEDWELPFVHWNKDEQEEWLDLAREAMKIRDEERFAIARRVEDAVYKFLSGESQPLSHRMSHKDLLSATREESDPDDRRPVDLSPALKEDEG